MIKNSMRGYLSNPNRERVKLIAIIAGIIAIIVILASYLSWTGSSDTETKTASIDTNMRSATKVSNLDTELDVDKTEVKTSGLDTRASVGGTSSIEEELSRLRKQNEELSSKIKNLEKQLRDISAVVNRSSALKTEGVADKKSGNKPSQEKTMEKARGKESKISYTVKKGDTLWGIADKYGVSVNAIKEWNNLRDVRITTGDELIIVRP